MWAGLEWGGLGAGRRMTKTLQVKGRRGPKRAKEETKESRNPKGCTSGQHQGRRRWPFVSLAQLGRILGPREVEPRRRADLRGVVAQMGRGVGGGDFLPGRQLWKADPGDACVRAPVEAWEWCTQPSGSARSSLGSAHSCTWAALCCRSSAGLV